MRRIRGAAITFSTALLLSGCSMPALTPKGPIARAERDLLFDALGLMMIVAIPVFIMAFVFATRYRTSNRKARYTPDWSFSLGIEALVWLVPALIIVALGYLVWTATHRLDPYEALASTVEPVKVQVVAQDWKWLFIYPEQKVAVVNELVFPSEAPLSLDITSDTVMNAFFIPELGGQIYAMAGMRSHLNLLADEPGTFQGRNTQYSGDGFPHQHFKAVATTREAFDAWVEEVRQSSQELDAGTYQKLAEPTIGHSVTYYSNVEPDLFRKVIAKYAARTTGARGAE
ncbi:ubiquinol oxidase subunit II [Chelativorans sp. YIM 93263]|uniref:ubiquinol oxidase subunit II n=1 Tax=Chelativorans sp. YIM 93263 TaxID=2906648 RepID=UPI0023784593|nr:ubiquinol oxidase subunit II [Chelativorans sp. YIM 93263]